MGDTRFPRPFFNLRLYMDCRMFDFMHLPEPGGWLDQDPQLVEDWRQIRAIDAEHQKRQSEKR